MVTWEFLQGHPYFIKCGDPYTTGRYKYVNGKMVLEFAIIWKQTKFSWRKFAQVADVPYIILRWISEDDLYFRPTKKETAIFDCNSLTTEEK